eukprot:scaffold1055_cov165-Amphora_coffeaeformis.AAC.9
MRQRSNKKRECLPYHNADAGIPRSSIGGMGYATIHEDVAPCLDAASPPLAIFDVPSSAGHRSLCHPPKSKHRARGQATASKMKITHIDFGTPCRQNHAVRAKGVEDSNSLKRFRRSISTPSTVIRFPTTDSTTHTHTPTHPPTHNIGSSDFFAKHHYNRPSTMYPQRQGTHHRKRVIVLVSTLGVNRLYRPRQNRAVTLLEARKCPYEIVDGADPEQKERTKLSNVLTPLTLPPPLLLSHRRNQLFRISGSQSYPQFFLAEKKGTTSFLGDFGIIEGLHDADNLPSAVLEENPSLVTLKRVMGGSHHRKLFFLTTSLHINKDVVRRQERAAQILQASGVPFETVDGSDPVTRERREALFKISGRRGVYPQFFVHDDDVFDKEETVNYIGDWEHIEAVNDASGLPENMLAAHPAIKTWNNIFGNRVVVEGVGSGSAGL